MNAYDILEIGQDASQDELKASYHRLLLVYHPDKSTGQKDEATTDRFIRLHSAYRLLSNPSLRQAYDLALKQLQLQDKFSTDALASMQQQGDDEELERFYNLYKLDKDFEFDQTEQTFTRSCRCGSFFVIKRQDLNSILEQEFSASGQESVVVDISASDQSSSFIVGLECDTCSLKLNVLII